MLAGLFRALPVLAFALAIGSGVFVPDTNAHPRHHSHHHGPGVAVYPTVAIGVGPGVGVAPGVGVGLGLGVGFGYYPFSVGVAAAVPVPVAPADPRGALRIEVPQRETEVFVDGYYAGRVDDFDGSFQRLRLDPGPHTVTLYLEDHRLYEETVNSAIGSTIRLRHEMEPLEPGEPIPMRPSAGPSAVVVAAPYAAPTPAASFPAPAMATASAAGPAEYGVLSVRPQPGGVEVWIDGELWDLPADSERFSIHLPAGPHTLELRKEGYETFALPVEIERGETEALNVRLAPSP